MRQWLIRLGGAACVVAVLAVALLGAHAAGLLCFSRGSGGPATVSQGPVTIGTDHSVYASSDTITVTLTNHFDTSIFLVSQAPPSGGGTCPLIVLVKIDSAQGGVLTPCYGREVAPSINSTSVPAGNSGGVAQFNNANLATALSDGTYQVHTLYIVSGSGVGLDPKYATAVASPTFRVCTCRIC